MFWLSPINGCSMNKRAAEISFHYMKRKNKWFVKYATLGCCFVWLCCCSSPVCTHSSPQPSGHPLYQAQPNRTIPHLWSSVRDSPLTWHLIGWQYYVVHFSASEKYCPLREEENLSLLLPVCVLCLLRTFLMRWHNASLQCTYMSLEVLQHRRKH